MRLTRPLLIAATILTVGATLPSNSFATDDTEQFACAAVYVCDADGNVPEEYQEGPCAQRYAEQCKMDHSTQLHQCIDTATSLQKKMNSLQTRIKQIRRQLRAKSR